MEIKELQSIKKRLGELAPSCNFSSVNLPPFEHCVGSGKLLGEYYGEALSESLMLYDSNKLCLLDKLCLFMRSYVVLDDFLKDKIERKSANRKIAQWLKNIENEIIDLICKLGGDSKLWGKYHQTYQKAYYEYDFSNPFRSTMNKCSFIFLPFDLPIFKNQGSVCRNTIKFFEYFLFSLQLLDDFKDMNEDRMSHRNHNLYTAKLTCKYSILVETNKTHLLPSVLNLIHTGLEQFENITTSNVISNFRSNSLKWIKKYSFHLHQEKTIDKHFSSFDSWNFFHDENIEAIKTFLLNSKKIHFNLNEISAESMHTIK